MSRSILERWAATWNVPPQAMADLHALLRDAVWVEPSHAAGTPEQEVQNAIRREARDKGLVLMRNNVGVLRDKDGRPVRYGLANDSAPVNRRIKSGDLIGIRRVMITSAMVGSSIGQFVSREVKAPGWRYNPNNERSPRMRG